MWCSVPHCPPSKRRVPRTGGNTTGLRDHLRECHVTLSVCRMTGSHTGEYVRDLLDMTLAAWEMDGRCFAAVTDNGANFVKAARLAKV